MSVTVESATASKEPVSADPSAAAEPKETENKSAPAPKEEQGESAEDSESEGVKDDVSAEEDDSSDEDGDESQENPEKPKKRSGFKRRIDKLNARLSEREREIEYWRQEALKNTKKQDASENVQSKETSKADGKPNPDDFATHEEYVEKLADWKVDQKLREKEAKEREAQVKSEAQKQAQEFGQKLRDFSEAHEDFDELVENVEDIQMSLTVQETILDSDVGPELMYELAKNREEYARICKLPALKAARELGRIEAQILKAQESKKTEVKEVKKTKAPTPIKPIGSKNAVVAKSLEDMDYEEFKKARNEQLRKR